MSGTFSQIYIHIVFAVIGRHSLIHSSWEERLYKYITGIVQKKEQKMLAINGMPNHIHFLTCLSGSLTFKRNIYPPQIGGSVSRCFNLLMLILSARNI